MRESRNSLDNGYLRPRNREKSREIERVREILDIGVGGRSRTLSIPVLAEKVNHDPRKLSSYHHRSPFSQTHTLFTHTRKRHTPINRKKPQNRRAMFLRREGKDEDEDKDPNDEQSGDDMSEEDDEAYQQKRQRIIYTAVLVAVATIKLSLYKVTRRRNCLFPNRLSWDNHLSIHSENAQFHRALRMPLLSFQKLVNILRPRLQRDEQQASLRGGVIVPEISVFVALRWLAGGSFLDICPLVGISKSAFYETLWRAIYAIFSSKHHELDNIHFPQTFDECTDAAAGFESISHCSAIRNCVSAIDGYLLKIQTPSSAEVGNVRSYFSGHYQCHGVNIQAACDHLCRFTFIGVAGPGVMPDRDAIHQISLGDLIDRLPIGFVCIGDAAYTPTEHLAPIYFGNASKKKRYDHFNFYASQLRIRIEMAFGLMVAKWRVLQLPSRLKVARLKFVMLSIARLHNYCINERSWEDLAAGSLAEDDPQNLAASFTPTTPHDRTGRPVEDQQLFSTSEALKGMSITRESMVDRIALLGLSRPVPKRKRS